MIYVYGVGVGGGVDGDGVDGGVAGVAGVGCVGKPEVCSRNLYSRYRLKPYNSENPLFRRLDNFRAFYMYNSKKVKNHPILLYKERGGRVV